VPEDVVGAAVALVAVAEVPEEALAAAVGVEVVLEAEEEDLVAREDAAEAAVDFVEEGLEEIEDDLIHKYLRIFLVFYSLI